MIFTSGVINRCCFLNSSYQVHEITQTFNEILIVCTEHGELTCKPYEDIMFANELFLAIKGNNDRYIRDGLQYKGFVKSPLMTLGGCRYFILSQITKKTRSKRRALYNGI